MNKRFYFLTTATLLLLIWACSPKTGQQGQTTTTGTNIITPAGKRKAIDPANMDLTVRPQDDFYQYANGAWLKNTPIPPSESRWASFSELNDFNQKALKDICEELAVKSNAKGSTQQKVGDFYATGMDSAAIEKAGIAPIKAHLDRINAIKNYTGLLDEIAFHYSEGLGGVWGLLDPKLKMQPKLWCIFRKVALNYQTAIITSKTMSVSKKCARLTKDTYIIRSA
jgi:predicted metalloendopeptidase